MPSEKRLVGLRLDDKTYGTLEKVAEKEARTVAKMAEALLRLGLEHFKPGGKAHARKS